MSSTRRDFLRAVAIGTACGALPAVPKEFWNTKEPANWSAEEKQFLLEQSPWAREGFARMEVQKKRSEPGYGRNGQQGVDMPDTRPGVGPGGTRSVPIGGEIPPVPNPDPGHPLQFRVLARWETAKPVRLAGAPELPQSIAGYYVIRLYGLPLMPPPKAKPGEPPVNPNEGMLQAIKQGSRLERRDKAPIVCDHLFTGSGDKATQVLLFFPSGKDPITVADKVVTLESSFASFHLSVKFTLKEMMYRGELSL